MPVVNPIAALILAGAFLTPLIAPSPAEADVRISYYGGYGKAPYYKRGFGYGHYPPYAVKRPRIYGYSPYLRHGRYGRYGRHRGYGYARHYSHGHAVPWRFNAPYYRSPHVVYRAPIERKTRPNRSDRIVWNAAPRGQAQAPVAAYCAPFEDRVRIDGRWQKISGRACQQPDGTWKIVSK